MQKLVCVALLAACGGDSVAIDIDAAPGPFDLPVQCTSNTHWKSGSQRSPLMRPGAACIDCHTSSFDAPPLMAAGTVYATGHEPDNCNGSGGATVEITDQAGTLITLSTNDAGNFYTDAMLAFPIHAKVIVGNNERAMLGTVMTGDCNSCHTQAGIDDAPGRIVMP